MLRFLRPIFSKKTQEYSTTATAQDTPSEIKVQGLQPLLLDNHLMWHHGLPIPDWSAIYTWLDTASDESIAGTAYGMCERLWLSHLAAALGPDYHLSESEQAIVLSSLEPRIAQTTLAYMARALKYISHTLDGLAEISPDGKDILIIFNGEDEYYRYISYYYPDEGEFAFSGGMFIGENCGHFVTVKNDLSHIEPIIVHEMTHAALSHLSLPVWLDEGLAVNLEQKLTGVSISSWQQKEMREKHLRFWGEKEVQEFWSGQSFERPDEGNPLSYDLARILVEQLSRDWTRFQQFVLMAADQNDSGAQAAYDIFGMTLGEILAALLEHPSPELFNPGLCEKPLSE